MASLGDGNAVAMFYACALDLLAETEAQHRAVMEAQTRLERCLAEWSIQPPTPAGRLDRLSAVAAMVRAVVATVATQRILAADMQRAMAALQENGEHHLRPTGLAGEGEARQPLPQTTAEASRSAPSQSADQR